MVSKIAVVAVLIVLAIAVVIVVFSVMPSSTSNVDLYDTGAAQGDNGTAVTPGTPPGTQPPPGTEPSPTPSPTAQKIGTFAMGAVVFYQDGTDETLIGSQGFTVYRNSKAVQSFAYQGEFRADVGVSFARADNVLHVFRRDAAGNAQKELTYGITYAATIAAGGKATLIAVQVYVDQVFEPYNPFVPPTIPDGTYHVTFTMQLRWTYTSNGTAGPTFYLTFPDVTVCNNACSGTTATGGGGGSHYYLSIADVRIWAAYRKV